MAEDRQFQLAQRGAGIDSVFVAEIFAGAPQGGQCLRLLPGPILRGGQQPGDFLAFRVLLEQGAQLDRDLGGPIELEFHARAHFGRGEPQFGQACGLVCGPGEGGQAVEGGAGPAGQCAVEQSATAERIGPAAGGPHPLLVFAQQRLELPDVHGLRCEFQCVAGGFETRKREGARRGRSGSTRRRRLWMCTCRTEAAVGGGSPSQRSSMRRSAVVGRGPAATRRARTARNMVAPNATGRSSRLS